MGWPKTKELRDSDDTTMVTLVSYDGPWTYECSGVTESFIDYVELASVLVMAVTPRLPIELVRGVAGFVL